jgi:MoaA/NifB/PqqE/SkfB family radical SAM enzyme
MPLLNLNLATLGMDPRTRLKVLKRHLEAFLRHMTPRRLANFVLAELNRLTKREVVASMPYILKIESSNICNLRCAFCYDDRSQPGPGQRPYGRMTALDFARLLDEVGPYLFKINLYGFGEPFLFPETFDMIKAARAANVGVGVSSNLNVDDPELARKVVGSGLEVLIFSCHGASQETYARFMQKGNRELALRNLAAIIAERRRVGTKYPLIDWQYCVTKFNQHEVEQAVALAQRLGVDQIRFIRPDFPDDAPEEWFSDLFPRRAEEAAAGGMGGCSWPWRSAYINYDGGLLPCCREVRETANDFGNVLTQGFKAVWNNPRYRAARRLIADPSRPADPDIMCSRCPALGRVPPAGHGGSGR